MITQNISDSLHFIIMITSVIFNLTNSIDSCTFMYFLNWVKMRNRHTYTYIFPNRYFCIYVYTDIQIISIIGYTNIELKYTNKVVYFSYMYIFFCFEQKSEINISNRVVLFLWVIDTSVTVHNSQRSWRLNINFVFFFGY